MAASRGVTPPTVVATSLPRRCGQASPLQSGTARLARSGRAHDSVVAYPTCKKSEDERGGEDTMDATLMQVRAKARARGRVRRWIISVVCWSPTLVVGQPALRPLAA